MNVRANSLIKSGGVKMKIKLIAPHEISEENINSAETFKIHKVNLPLLAALTPPEHTVKIVDEAFAPDDSNEEVDLVGISVMTDLVLRAYQIGDAYRQRGVKVVMGGIHATVLPGEVLRHADAVVVGEAEEIWPKLLSHAASGDMKELYRATHATNLDGLPLPRRDLCPKPFHKGYVPLAFGIETARGCPNDCEFCSIGSTMGRQYRSRPVSEVIAEIESIDSSYLFFVDDSLALNRSAAKRFFEAMAPLGRRWAGQGPVSLAEDLELLKLMRRSGCVGLLVGFESVQKLLHQRMKKTRNLKIDFSEAMRRFHGEGIGILGAFVFGSDNETKDVFDQTLEFSAKNRLDGIELRILSPYPGTRLYSRLFKEGRLFVHDWWLHGYPPDTLLFQPKGMSAEELVEGFNRLNRHAYSLGSIVKRFFGMNPWKRDPLGCLVYAGLNLGTRKRYLKGLSIPQPFVGTADAAEETNSLGAYA
jgi:radical SAM superfamily enzyme YgiQ (UPF0313 family)